MRLTEEQRDFAEKNHALVLKYMNSRNLPIWDSDSFTGEDWYGIICIAFCKAVATYRDDCGWSFSTYAYACMDNARKIVYRKQSNAKSIPVDMIESLDMDIYKKNRGEMEKIGSLSEVLGGNEFEEDSVEEVTFSNFLSTLSPLESQILNLSLADFTQIEIGKITGFSQSYVSRLAKNITEKWKKYTK